MQMDGNFGITAGIAEMLVQSHEGKINLLPTLPKAWPSGIVHGLRTRGGFEVDVQWDNGNLTAARIVSVNGTGGKVRSGDRLVNLNLRPGTAVLLNGTLAGQLAR